MGSVKIKNKDKGFKKLVASLGDMGEVRLGVQGKEADAKHPESELTVGAIAAIHELGLGVPRRSWLVDWVDENAERVKRESKKELRAVMKGTTTRNKALIKLGYAWTVELRERVSSGKIRPALAMKRRDGSSEPLYDTHTLHNAITYKVFLPNKKSIRNTKQRNIIK